MLLEEYIQELQNYITDVINMFDKLIKTSEGIGIDYVSDEESVESEVEITDADINLLNTSVENSRASLGEISVGLKQVLERYNALSEVSLRRKDRIDQLEGKIYEQSTGETIKDEDEELRKLYAPLLEGLSEFEIQERLTQLRKIRGN